MQIEEIVIRKHFFSTIVTPEIREIMQRSRTTGELNIEERRKAIKFVLEEVFCGFFDGERKVDFLSTIYIYKNLFDDIEVRCVNEMFHNEKIFVTKHAEFLRKYVVSIDEIVNIFSEILGRPAVKIKDYFKI